MRLVTRVTAVILLMSAVCIAESPSRGEDAAGTDNQQRKDVAFLASDRLRGRGVGDPTIDEAADYVASRMKAIGLQTDLFDGTPMQQVEVPLEARAGSAQENRIVFDAPTRTVQRNTLRHWAPDMNPLGIGISDADFKGPVAFVGYGVTAPKLNYDDYANINVAGQAVIMLRKEPSGEKGDAVFSGSRNTRHAYFATKISNAIAHQAAAVILVNDAESVAESVRDKQKRVAARERSQKALGRRRSRLCPRKRKTAASRCENSCRERIE